MDIYIKRYKVKRDLRIYPLDTGLEPPPPLYTVFPPISVTFPFKTKKNNRPWSASKHHKRRNAFILKWLENNRFHF